MNTFIISSKNKELTNKKVGEINKENEVNKFDIESFETEKAFGIDDVKKIQQKIFLKPSFGKRKTIIINLDKGISTEAQNAMLKLLEEPPPSSVIILLVENSGIFLPTILSRAKIIIIKEDYETKPYSEIDTSPRDASEALVLAQNVSKDKTEAITWLEETILCLRKEMIGKITNKNESLNIRKKIHKLELTHYDLKNTNINVRLTLENLFLNLISSGNR